MHFPKYNVGFCGKKRNYFGGFCNYTRQDVCARQLNNVTLNLNKINNRYKFENVTRQILEKSDLFL